MEFTDYEKQLEEVYACLETEYTENLPVEHLIVLNQCNIHYARITRMKTDFESIYNKEFLIIKNKLRNESGKTTEKDLEEQTLLSNDGYLLKLKSLIDKFEGLLKALSKAIDSCRTIISFAKTELNNSNI